MDYISIKEAAELWKIDISRVGRLAREGRIAGAKIVGRKWMIPKNSQKPTDGRTKKGKSEEKAPPFRFPLLVNREERDFYPALSEEEKFLRNAELDYYACEFDNAKTAFESLLNDTKSVYVKIMVLFYLCSLSVEAYGGQDYQTYYNELRLLLAKDFPYKKEMEIILPWLYTILVQYQMTAESFIFDVAYDYSESVLPLLSYLSVFHYMSEVLGEINTDCLDSYELLCRHVSLDDAYYEACELHFILFCAYYIIRNENAALYHLRKGMDIATEHNILLLPSCYLPYYSDAFLKIAKEYPDLYMDKIKRYSEKISESLGEFTKKQDITKIYSRLSSNDYRYILFVTKGFSNKQVADICGVSERTVANVYNNIYNKLGINSKKELIDEINHSLSNKR